LRVVHITTQHPPMDDRIFYKEAISLRDGGHQVTVVAGGSRDREATVDGIRIIEVSPGRGRPRGLLRRRRLTRVALNLAPDVIHSHEPDSLGIACRVKEERRSRVVYDAHENYQGLAATGEGSWIRRKAIASRLRAYEERCCPRADLIFAATEPLGHLLEMHGPVVNPLYNYPRTEIFHPEEDPEISNRYSGKSVFVYAGSLRRSRGPGRMVSSILELSREYPDLMLSILSPHPVDPLLEGLDPMEREHFDYHGFIQHTRVPRYLTVGLAGLVLLDRIPTYQIAAPIKMFEYMACGIPVIATRLEELSRFLEPNDAGILVGEDDDELVEAMRTMLDHPGVASEMGGRGMRAVEGRYNWSVSERTLLRSYEDLE